MSNGPYPLIEQACAEVAAYLAEERVDVKTLSRAERSRRERLLAAKDEHAKAAARAAYAAELLPAVLGGEWTFSRRFGYSPEYLFKWDTEIDLRSVFDHALVYRRRSRGGALTWRTAAVIGRPYDALSREGAPKRFAVAAAISLAERGIGVWVRPDLSAWYPGWTQLVLAAPALLGLDAARFGFRDLAVAAVTPVTNGKAGGQSFAENGKATPIEAQEMAP